MPADQRIDRDGGRAVVVKAAPPGADADRLAAEALVLARASLPGVVEVVRAERTEAGGFELVTALAGTRTLVDARLDVGTTAAVIAALATTVADLHALGIAHRRLTPDHVVLHGSGRPVLCGFGGAAEVERASVADDMAALGELLTTLLCGPAGAAGDWEPIPERRFRRRARVGVTRRALL
nr:protein kinase family protein [Acidimicrobiia bacterium]